VEVEEKEEEEAAVGAKEETLTRPAAGDLLRHILSGRLIVFDYMYLCELNTLG
jgi:hypothetical protein